MDRRVWENKEVGHGYQHRTVVRQAAATFDKVKIKDMSKGTTTNDRGQGGVSLVGQSTNG